MIHNDTDNCRCYFACQDRFIPSLQQACFLEQIVQCEAIYRLFFVFFLQSFYQDS